MPPENITQKYPSGIVGVEMKEVERQVPATDPPPMPINSQLKIVGKPTTRIDGRLKVTGAAKYSSDINLPGLLYGRMVTAPHASAKVKSIDTTAAENLPGVKAVYVLEKVQGGASSRDDNAGTKYPVVRYAGQPVAAVAAITPDIARDAVKLVKVEYEAMPFVVDVDKAKSPDSPLVFTAPAAMGATGGGGGGAANVDQKGNVRGPSVGPRNAPEKDALDKAFATSDAVVEAEYQTQVQTHCALETHGIVADWKPDQLNVWASTQGTLSVRDELADIFELEKSRIHVITEFMGGGFGAKFGAGNWGVLAVNLSKKAGAPVKLMCDRKEEQTGTGNRPDSHQYIKVGGKKDGTLTAIYLTNYGTGGTGTGAGAGNPARSLYDCPLIRTEEYDVFTHAGPAAAFRAPGHPQGAFSFEQAIDELAEKLGIDPLTFREKIDKSEARRYERKIGAEKFGWSKRQPAGSDAGPVKRGMGFAQSLWGRGSNRGSQAEVRITHDGSVTVLSAVQDIGGGIRTAMAMLVAEELGLKTTDITVKIGDSFYPVGPGSGGSVTTNSMAPVTRTAAYGAKKKFLHEVGTALGVKEDDLDLADGKVIFKTDASKSLPFKSAAAKMQVEQISEQATRGGDYGNGPGTGGVQFTQVAVDVQTGLVKVEKVLAVHDCGRPINPLALTSQINGGVIQGTSYCLYENRVLDRQTGFMVNQNMEQYKIAGAREIPEIEVMLIEQYEGRSSVDAGVIGEPANVATAAAIANAVYNAIGVRVRRIPMTPSVVLDALARAGKTA